MTVTTDIINRDKVMPNAKTASDVALLFLGDFDPTVPFVRHLTHKQMRWLNNLLGPHQERGSTYFNWTISGVEVSCAYTQRYTNNRNNSWTGRLDVRPVPVIEAPVPVIEAPVEVSQAPDVSVTWESLAMSRYGTTVLTRGQKGAVTREFNRRMGIAPRKRTDYGSPAWILKATTIYPGMAISEMKPWQKAKVTKSLSGRSNPDLL